VRREGREVELQVEDPLGERALEGKAARDVTAGSLRVVGASC
jgi:hypothetical protein